MTTDDLLQWQETALPEAHQTWQHRGHLDARELLQAGGRVAQHDGKVDRQPADVGERVRGVDCQRGQYGEDAFGEEGAHPRLLLVTEIDPTDDVNALAHQPGTHVVVEDTSLLGDQLMGALQYRLVKVTWHLSGDSGHGDTSVDTTFEPGDAHHEELVEIGGEDGQELRTLDQRDALVIGGEVEHTPVERQPGQFTIAVALTWQISIRLCVMRGRVCLLVGHVHLSRRNQFVENVSAPIYLFRATRCRVTTGLRGRPRRPSCVSPVGASEVGQGPWGSAIDLEPVPHRPDGVDVTLELRTDLCAQSADVDVDGTCSTVVVVAPHL